MPIIKIEDVNKIGIIRDQEPYRLPLNAWSDGNNMQFIREAIHKNTRWSHLEDTNAACQDARGIFRGFTGTGNVWCYLGLTKARAFDDSTDTDITRAAGNYTGTDSDLWQAVEFNGKLILTNGVDAVQLWDTPATGTVLKDLTNWPGGATAKNVRAFLNYLVALNIKEGGIQYPQMVKWSTNAAANAVPSSWDQTDPTKLAGEYILGDTPGACLDAVILGNQMVIYKEDAVWAMRFVGGNLIFGFQALFKNFGLLAPNCAVDLGIKHFVATRADVLTHDGNSWQSILENKDRQWLFNNMDPSGFKFSFTIHRKGQSEVWLCFPSIGSESCTMALVWNYKYDTITFNDLPDIRAAVTSPPIQSSVGDTWDGDAVTTWNGETVLVWDDPSFLKVAERDFMLTDKPAGVQNKIFEFADGSYADPNTTTYTSFVTRLDLDVVGMDKFNNIIRDSKAVKTLIAVYPRIKESKGTVINVYVAGRMASEDALVWQGPYPFTIGTSEKIDCWVTGRYISVKFSDDGAATAEWDLHSYDLELNPLGRF